MTVIGHNRAPHARRRRPPSREARPALVCAAAVFAGVLALSLLPRPALGGIGAAASAGSPAACAFTIGVEDSLDPTFFVETMGPTLAWLRKSFPRCAIRSRLLPPDGFRGPIDRREIDFFMADSGLYAHEAARSGARDIAVRQSPWSSDPSEETSCVIIVRRDDAGIRSIDDLKGRTVAAESETSFDGWLVAQALISSRGHDEEHFWGEKLFTRSGNPGIVDLVLSDEADAGVLRACDLEETLRRHNYDSSKLRVLNPQPGGALACLRSAPLYPGVVFASLPGADASLLREITLRLLEEPPSPGGRSWGVAGSFHGVDRLYRTLRLGPYAYLRTFNWRLFWEEYRMIPISLALIALLAFVHILRSNRLVEKRTLQLQLALARQEALEWEARESRLRMSRIERASMVSQMSGMLAHEVLQPVTALLNFAGGLRMYASRRFGDDPMVSETTGVIMEEARRVSRIVERVRAYAKGEVSGRAREVLSVSDAAEAALRTFRHSTTSTGMTVRTDVPCGLAVRADRLEMELVLFNLLKNGASAMAGLPADADRTLEISAREAGGTVRITVRDRGPEISEETFASLAEPVSSMKRDGLGLGLSICRAIIEHHGGRLVFDRASPGLAATAVLPAVDADPAARQGEAE